MDGPYWYLNLGEAVLWIALGLGVAVTAATRQENRSGLALLSVVLIAFGLSDIVETHTGAWWRPWWLLVWKGLCVLYLLRWAVRRIRRRSPTLRHSSS